VRLDPRALTHTGVYTGFRIGDHILRIDIAMRRLIASQRCPVILAQTDGHAADI